MKTVAGFDIPKLMVGSLGTLGLISTVTFRLHPLPETSAMVLVPGCSAAFLRELVIEIRRAQLEPASAVAVLSGTGLFDLAVLFEGFASGVDQQGERFLALLSRGGAGRAGVADAPARATFQGRHDAVRGLQAVRAKFAAPRSAVEVVSADVLPLLLGALENAGAVWYPTLGIGFAGGDAGTAGNAVATSSALLRARSVLTGLGGSLTVQAAPESIRSRVDVWGERPPSWPLLQAMKSRLDPERRLAPGRFVGAL